MLQIINKRVRFSQTVTAQSFVLPEGKLKRIVASCLGTSGRLVLNSDILQPILNCILHDDTADYANQTEITFPNPQTINRHFTCYFQTTGASQVDITFWIES